VSGIVPRIQGWASIAILVEQAEYLNAVKYSVDSLLTVINDILDLSMIEVRKLSLDPIEFNLRDYLGFGRM
jgi:signal transduction histidine kinase